MGWVLLVFLVLIIIVVYTNLHKPTKEKLEKMYVPGAFFVGIAAPHYAATIEKLVKKGDSK